MIIDSSKIKLGNFIFEKSEDQWIFKAEPLKKDGTLKAQYKDLPRYKVIYSIEDKWKQSFDTLLQETMKGILTHIKTQIK